MPFAIPQEGAVLARGHVVQQGREVQRVELEGARELLRELPDAVDELRAATSGIPSGAADTQKQRPMRVSMLQYKVYKIQYKV